MSYQKSIFRLLGPSVSGILIPVLVVALTVFGSMEVSAQDKKGRKGQAESDAPAASGRKSSRGKNKKPFLSSPSPRPGGDRVSPSTPGVSRRSRTSKGSGDQPYRGRSVSGRQVTQRRPQSRAVFVYPQSGPWTNNPKPTPDRRQRASEIRLPSSVSGRIGAPVGPRVARDGMSDKRRLPHQLGSSRPYISGGRMNPYWGKIRLDHGPVMRDLTGRPLRRRDFRSASSVSAGRSGVAQPFGRTGRAAAGASRSRKVRTATTTGRSWSGDISGRKVRAGRKSFSPGGVSGQASTGSVGAAVARNGMKYGKRIPGGRSDGALQRQINANRQYMNNVSEMPNRNQQKGERSGTRIIQSASGTYVARARKDPYWGKTRLDHGQVTTDLSGRPLRRKDFRSASPVSTNRDSVRNAARVPSRASGSSSGVTRKVRSNSESGRAWSGDISGRSVRADRRTGGRGSGQPLFSRSGRNGNFMPAYGNAYRNGAGRGVGGFPGRQSARFSAQPNYSRPPLGSFRLFETSTALVSGITGIVDLRVNPFNPNRSRSGNISGGFGNRARIGGVTGRQAASFAARPNYSRPPLGSFRLFESSTALVSGLTGKIDLRVKPSNPNRYGRRSTSASGSRARVGGVTGRQSSRMAARPNYSRPPLGSFRLFESSTALVSGLTGKIDLRVKPSNPNRYGRRSTTASGSRARVSGVTGRQASRVAARPNYSRPPLGSFRLFESSTALVSGLTGKIDLRVNPANPQRVGRRSTTGSGNRARISGLTGRQSSRIAARPNYSRPPLGSFRLFETSTSLVSGLTGKVDLRVKPSNPNRVGRRTANTAGNRARIDGLTGRQSSRIAARPNYSRSPMGGFRLFETSPSSVSGLSGKAMVRVKPSNPNRVGQRKANFTSNRSNIGGLTGRQSARIAARPNYSRPPLGSFRLFETSTSLVTGLTGKVDLRVKPANPNRLRSGSIRSNPDRANVSGVMRQRQRQTGLRSNYSRTSAGVLRRGGNRVNVSGLANRQPMRGSYERPQLRRFSPFRTSRTNVTGELRQRTRQSSVGQNFSRPPAGKFRSYQTNTSVTSGLTGVVDLRVRRSDPDRVGRMSAAGNRGLSSRSIGGINNRLRATDDRVKVSGLANRQRVSGNASKPRLQGYTPYSSSRVKVGGLANRMPVRSGFGKPDLRRFRPFDTRQANVAAQLRQRPRQSSARPNFSKPPAGQFRAYRTNTSLTTGLTGVVDLRVQRSNPDRVGRINAAGSRNVSARAIGGLNNRLRSGADRVNVGGLANRQAVRGPYGQPRLRRFTPYSTSPANVGGLNNRLATRGAYGKPDVRRYNPYDPTQANVSAELRQRLRHSSARPNFSKPPAGQFRAYRTNTTLTSGLTGVVDLRFRRANPDQVLRQSAKREGPKGNLQRVGFSVKPSRVQLRQYEVRGRLPKLDRNRAAGKYAGDLRYTRSAGSTSRIGAYKGDLNARQVNKDQYHTPTFVKMMRGDFAGGLVRERNGNREDRMIAGYTERTLRNPYRSNMRYQNQRYEVHGRLPDIARSNAAAKYSGGIRYSNKTGNASRIASYRGDLNARAVNKDQYHTPTFVKMMRGDFVGGLVRERNGNREDKMIAGYTKRSLRNPFRSDWITGPNTADGALRQRRPAGNITATASIRGAFRLRGQPQGTMSNRNLNDIRRIASGSGRDTRGITRQVKDKDYVLSPSGEKKALKVDRPVAGGRIQGDLKTERRENSRYADVNRDMKADQEGTRKLNGLQKAWNYFFGKAEEGPKKEKFQKPRYDPREQGIWNY